MRKRERKREYVCEGVYKHAFLRMSSFFNPPSLSFLSLASSRTLLALLKGSNHKSQIAFSNRRGLSISSIPPSNFLSDSLQIPFSRLARRQMSFGEQQSLLNREDRQHPRGDNDTRSAPTSVIASLSGHLRLAGGGGKIVKRLSLSLSWQLVFLLHRRVQTALLSTRWRTDSLVSATSR